MKTKLRKPTPAGSNWVVSTIAGTAGYYGTNDGTGSAARFFYPAGMTVDSARVVYVVDQVNSTIRKLTPVGANWVVNTIGGLAGSSGAADGTNDGARFAYPQGLAVDNHGSVFVADSDNATIRQGVPYTVPPLTAFAIAAEAFGGAVVLTWEAVPGRSYQLQYKACSAQTCWTNLGGTVTATNSAGRATDAPAGPQRFYRVVLLP
jgi:hypothetical protein